MALCDNCNINPASIHIVQVMNGKKLTHNLCKACAVKDMHLHAGDITVDKLLAGMMNPIKTLEDNPPELKCSECGTEFEKFSKTGKVGCAQCYVDFKPYIEQMLSKAQKGMEHTGRQPKANTDEDIVRIGKLRELRSEMRSAIGEENFERAAQIRDEIALIEV